MMTETEPAGSRYSTRKGLRFRRGNLGRSAKPLPLFLSGDAARREGTPPPEHRDIPEGAQA